jgi:hypothetical protein
VETTLPPSEDKDCRYLGTEIPTAESDESKPDVSEKHITSIFKVEA